MPTFAIQTPDTKSQSRERRALRPPPVRSRELNAGATPNGQLTLQRTPHCACGGGCPHCQATSGQLGAIPTSQHSRVVTEQESSPRNPASEFESTPQAGQQQARDAGAGDEALGGQMVPPFLSPTPVATTYPGCTVAQNATVETARTTALTKATNAASAMTALKGGTGTAAQQTALTAHFGALAAAQFDTAKSTYTTISGRLGNAALFACGSAPAQPYCGPPDSWCAGTVCPTTTGISYLCPNAFAATCAEPNLWSILLHESGRAAGCCPPDVMPSAATYPPAAPACLTNVYSYSGFARAI